MIGSATARLVIVVAIVSGAILSRLLFHGDVAGQLRPAFEPPNVTADLFLDRASVERGSELVTGTLIVTNESNLSIDATVRSASREFVSDPVSLKLLPYSAPELDVAFRVADDAEFGDQKVTVLVSYAWAAQGEAPAGSGATSVTSDIKLVGVAGQLDFEQPKVSAELLLDRASVERSGGSIVGALVITNPSNLSIEATITSASRDFTFDAPISLVLPPRSAPQTDVTFNIASDAAFGDQKATVRVSYTWATQGEAPGGSAETSADASVKLLHHFEEETGIVDGGAAALYFLMPLLILFTAFVVSRSFLLDGQFPPKLPGLELKTFPLLILAAAVVYAGADRIGFEIYTGDLPSDSVLCKIVLYMTLLGVAIPSLLWAIRTGMREIWGFSGDETAGEIIRKAITGPMGRVDFEEVTATVNATEYKGILLEERERCFFLGPVISVTPESGKLPADEDARFESDVVSPTGEIINRQRLAELVKQGNVTFGLPTKVKRGKLDSAKLVCRVDAKLVATGRQPSALVKAALRQRA